jgi:hypothetical protein
MLLRYQPMESALMRVLGLDAPRVALVLDLAVLEGFAALLDETPEADCSGVPTPLPPEINCARNVAPLDGYRRRILNGFRIGDRL